MNIPETGRVVIVDDMINEAQPLMNVLSIKGLSFTYFSGTDYNALPKEQIPNVRIVFLDIVLGTEGQSLKTQASTAARALREIIGENNGPYILIAWTKHKDDVDELKKYLTTIPPTIILCLDKLDYFSQGKDGEYVPSKNILKRIEKKLHKELTKTGALHLFLLWEALVHKSAGEIVNDFSSLYQSNNDWDNNISGIFHNLAEAYLGKQLRKRNGELVKSSLLVFNTVFLDRLEHNIRNFSKFDTISMASGKKPDGKINAMINSKLLLVFDGGRPQPGNVYEGMGGLTKVKKILADIIDETAFNSEFCKMLGKEHNKVFDNSCVKEAFKKQHEYFKDTYMKKLCEKITFVELEISPSCDYAQNKWRVHRLLPGFKCPETEMKNIKTAHKPDHIYLTPLFDVSGSLCYLVFDLKYFESVSFGKLKKKKPVLRVRRELLADIQSHLSKHINRPGLMCLNVR